MGAASKVLRKVQEVELNATRLPAYKACVNYQQVPREIAPLAVYELLKLFYTALNSISQS